MIVRALVLAACLLATGSYLAYAARAEPTPIREPLSTLPMSLDNWRGQKTGDLSQEILEVLRVDDYVSRSYASEAGNVGLYIGYHATQRQGASIHSPLNCLPGGGWTPAQHAHVQVNVTSADGTPRTIEVNRVVIERGIDRQLVVYWYQSRDRIVASEYWGKFYSVADAIRYNRTDAALVRVIAPVDSPDQPRALRQAEQLAVDFVQDVFPLLSRHLPS